MSAVNRKELQGIEMAARISPKLDQSWREKIQISMLINRLMDHANGAVEMSSTQIKAAEILLRKSLPDLAAVQHSGEDGGPVKMIIEWNKTNSPSES